MIFAIVQVRMSSSRLPGKALYPLLGKPMLIRQLERLHYSDGIDDIIVATSIDRSDDCIEQWVEQEGFYCFRGSLNDVLDRYYTAASQYKAEHIVRITADCPLLDAQLLDNMLVDYFESNVDYLSNVSSPTFPDGLDVEIFSFNALERAWKQATLLSEREHVTSFIRDRKNNFSVKNFSNHEDLSHMRWTVDYPEDYHFVKQVYERCYPYNAEFTMNNVLQELKKDPNLQQINSNYQRNEGYKKSLREDKKMGDNNECTL